MLNGDLVGLTPFSYRGLEKHVHESRMFLRNVGIHHQHYMISEDCNLNFHQT
jgi:hypothetical protein